MESQSQAGGLTLTRQPTPVEPQVCIRAPLARHGCAVCCATMRALLFIVCLPLCGCGPAVPVGSLETKREVASSDGTNLLSLVDVVVGKALVGSEVDYDFHSLVWKARIGTNLVNRCIISKTAFQAGRPRIRGVSDIHSLDSIDGTAIIKVAEDSPPVTNGTTVSWNTVYSWREWSLLTNGEVRVLRVCKEPFEKY